MKPLALKPPLTLLGARSSAGGDHVELAKLVRRLFGQLSRVVLDVVKLKKRNELRSSASSAIPKLKLDSDRLN